MKLRYILYLAVLTLFSNSCSKEDAEELPSKGLENSTWVATMTDDNPSTNPPGEFGVNGSNQYFPWQDCHLDDSFIFLKDRLTIYDNETPCHYGIDLIFNTKSQAYFYNEEKKQLMIGNGKEMIMLDVYELNNDRLKVGLSVPGPEGGITIIFLFKRKYVGSHIPSINL